MGNQRRACVIMVLYAALLIASTGLPTPALLRAQSNKLLAQTSNLPTPMHSVQSNGVWQITADAPPPPSSPGMKPASKAAQHCADVFNSHLSCLKSASNIWMAHTFLADDEQYYCAFQLPYNNVMDPFSTADNCETIFFLKNGDGQSGIIQNFDGTAVPGATVANKNTAADNSFGTGGPANAPCICTAGDCAKPDPQNMPHTSIIVGGNPVCAHTAGEGACSDSADLDSAYVQVVFRGTEVQKKVGSALVMTFKNNMPSASTYGLTFDAQDDCGKIEEWCRLVTDNNDGILCGECKVDQTDLFVPISSSGAVTFSVDKLLA